jgi:hypothetical protein
MSAAAFKWVQKKPALTFAAILEQERQDAERAARQRLAWLPWHWARHVDEEFTRRGRVGNGEARAWFEGVTEAGRGRLSLAATDDELRRAARAAAREGEDIAGLAGVRGGPALLALLADHCRRWGIEPARSGGGDGGPALRRMLCARWWLRRLRRAHGRRCDGAAIRGGVVRRGLWPYASQDAVERRAQQRQRNGRALARAVVACEATGEALALADVVAGSVANPEVKRAELMVRIKGCDAIAADSGAACEFWTLTAPSRFHAQRVTGSCAEPNPAFAGATPKEAQGYLSRVWARARAAWKRRGLEVFGLRTAEPHHDGCPHWHLIAYGPRRDLRFARRLLRVYALRDSPDEPGARVHRFKVLEARAGTRGAAYAAKYVSKNIDGGGMDGELDSETGKKVSDTARRVDAWASVWGIRQFQFFGCPSISIWRALRKMRGPVGVAGSMLERARAAADCSDFADFWRAAKRGGLALIYRAAESLTQYGDRAADRIAGVCEGARRALLPVKDWVIYWKGRPAGAGGLGFGVAFDLPWSCVNNCTPDRYGEAVGAVLAMG